MVSPRDRDIRPKDYKERAKKFRKVPPYTPDYQDLKGSSTHQRRPIDSGLEPFEGEWTDQHLMHLLKRTMFGVSVEDFESVKGLSLGEAVDLILTPNSVYDPPVNNYTGLDDIPEDPDVPTGNTWIYAPYANDFEGYRIISLKGWILKNMMTQGPGLQEKLTFFWHNLLPTEFFGIFVSKASYQYYSMLYRNCFGNFKEMIKDLTLNPAMLLYLNGAFNHKDAPDENYGRELQELFCLGKGPGSQYTEADVQAAARVLTGHTVEWDTFDQEGLVRSYFEPTWHDTSDKTFSEFFGNRVIEGKSGESGADELDELLDMIFDNDETALYICRRIYNFFVYNIIDEQTEANVIQPLAQIFRDNNYDITPVLSTLFNSAHFNDQENHGVMIKNPIDFMVGTMKTLELNNTSDELPLQLQYHATQLWIMAGFGLEIGDPPSVAGWPAYYQEPQFDKAWITTDTITRRAEITDVMALWEYWVTENYRLRADLPEFVKQLENPEEPNALLTELSSLFLGISPSDEGLTQLKGVLLDGQEQDYYWTTAWNNHLSEPDNEEYRLIVENRLKATFRRFFQYAEFQLN